MMNKAGMFVYALAFLVGVILLQQVSILPNPVALVILLTCMILLYLIVNRLLAQRFFKSQITLSIFLIILILFGILYSSYCAKQQLSYRLKENLVGRNIIVTGYVASLPVTDGKVQRFEFKINKHRILGITDNLDSDKKFPQKIRLSWYHGELVNAGDQWQLQVRLKPPHGFMNPGGFDYEAWLFQHEIDATGYVRKSSLNQYKSKAEQQIVLNQTNQIRQILAGHLDALSHKQNAMSDGSTQDGFTQESNSFALIKALAIGDKSSISSKQWRVLTNTGTSHLMAISGLHIGLAAFFIYSLVRRLVPVVIMKRVPGQHIALTAGVVGAASYALVAGLSIPTQRAFIMLFVLVVMALIRKNYRSFDALGLALLLVLLFDPLAVLSVGFWFSFSAVAVIFISLHSNNTDVVQKQAQGMVARWLKLISILKQWIRLQLLISLFLLPLSLFMFQQVSLVSPLANLLLIPYVSFLIVPVVLFAIVCSFIHKDLAETLFGLAAGLLDIIWPWLSWLATQPYALWVRGDIDMVKLVLATAAILLMYFSKRLSHFFSGEDKTNQKYINGVQHIVACCLLIPLFVTNKTTLAREEYQLTVLDVGQGSAAVIQTQNHTLVFDAGAKFSDRLNVGSSVVIPYLRSQGITTLDRLIISHGDADHIGGAQAILDEFSEADVIGQDIEKVQAENKRFCRQGLKWQWDGVFFTFLSPDMEAAKFQGLKRNNRSCVLHVVSGYASSLLTGDIEKKMERSLVEQYGAALASDILVVPHHGSNTSSSRDFIHRVNPKISLISVGYRNRYKLPNSKVLARYRAKNGDLLQTSQQGAMTIRVNKRWSEDRTRIVQKYRQKAGKYWHHTNI